VTRLKTVVRLLIIPGLPLWVSKHRYLQDLVSLVVAHNSRATILKMDLGSGGYCVENTVLLLTL
jgi:hypothetical protein